MKISLKWLREYIDWQGSVDELVEVLTQTGLSIENVETSGADFPKVVVAQILESNQHPDADRLSVCRVDDGSGTPRQIVCGAKNYKVGDKIPLAQPGAVLPGNFRIKVGKLRGVESEGMMCSGKELGMSADAAGLLILSPDAKVGEPISLLFPADTIIELEITPNRPDWLGHIGVARELAAFIEKEVRLPKLEKLSTKEDKSIARIDTRECPFYSAHVIRGVKVAPSPSWLCEKLESIGLRSINNIVDITNYVMFETGHPLHAFDLDKLNGGIVIRPANEGDKFLALDGKEYLLKGTHLVIADNAKPIALAGVMGGEGSGVTDSTRNILLESAVFDGSSIRRTAHGLGLHSDSSYRFERGTTVEGAMQASARAASLILEIAGGAADSETIVAGENAPAPHPITLRYNPCRNLLGVTLSNEEIDTLLVRLGLQKLSGDVDASMWLSAWYRIDLLREVDLIEEVARLHGMDKIPSRLEARPAHPTKSDAAYDFAAELRERLRALAFSEARTSTLISETMVRSLYAGDLLKVRNPLGEEQGVLRPTLLPELLDVVERNIRHGARAIRLFEIGRVFRPGNPEETLRVSLSITGEASDVHWRGESSRAMDLFDLKGAIEKIADGHVTFRSAEIPGFVLGLEVLLHDAVIGFVAQLPPAKAKAIDARGAVVVAELEFEKLFAIANRELQTQDIPKFPSVSRDIACLLKSETKYSDLRAVIFEAKEPLLIDVKLFDVFRDASGKKLPAEQKSLAFSLTFRSAERTLTSEEINAACDRVKARLKNSLSVDFRE